MNEMMQAALKYRENGLSVIPVKPRGKTPIVKWEEYQKRIASEDEIKKWWTSFPNANVGIVTGKVSNTFVVDLDKYDPKYSEDTFLKYFPDSIIAPTVVTARKGQHIYFSDPDNPNITIGARNIPGIDFRGNGGFVVAPPSIGENGEPYQWIDGMQFDRETLVPPPEEYIKKICNGNAPHASALKGASTTYINNKLTLYSDACQDQNRGICQQSVSNVLTCADTPYIILQDGTRDNDLFTVANGLIKSGVNKDFVWQVLERLILSFGENPDAKWIKTKIESALQRVQKRERNIHDEIREYILTQKCLQETDISLTECQQCLQLLTRQDKNAAYTAFKRLCSDEKLIEKRIDRRGIYRIVDNEKEKNKMDLTSEPEVQEVPVRMPLDLNDLCVISPGNIIVVSGSKSSGKTALMMNFAWMNQHNFEIVYLNSEMHETEFKKRMKKFAPLPQWKITGYSCHNNFEDYIESNPKRIYIIDYLEVHDNFYEIAKPIRKIHEKLGDAICIIGIQMKSGSSLGRGGDFSAEKARLYLTMDYNNEEKRTKVTIYDAKEPRPPFDNVRGKWRNVKIIEGNKLSTFAEWQW